MSWLKCFLTVWLLGASAVVLSADVLIQNVRVIGSDSTQNETADILIENGKIKAVGSGLAVSDQVRLIDGQGKALTVGLFNADTEIGVREIGAVAGTVDSSSSNPRISASLYVADAINPNSVLIPHNRSMGLTHALVVPNAGASLIAGTAAVVRLSESQTVVKDAAAVVINYGAQTSEKAGGSRAASLSLLTEAFEDARDYRDNRSSFNAGARRDYRLSRRDLAALVPVLERKLPLLVRVDRASDIRQILRFAQQQNLRLILGGALEAWRVAQEIAAANVPVIIDPINNLPSSYDTLGARLDNAKLLHEAGVTLLFTGMGWHRTHNAYLVRQSAGNAVANGLPYATALAAMTSNPAQTFGLGNLGEISPGAPANLVLWSGDPLEPETTVEALWLDGVEQSLISRQTRLRDRYFARYKSSTD